MPSLLDPLIVTSPVIRSGTTLLQRLLCSSREALIYGELCGQDLDFFLQLYMVKTQIYRAKMPAFALGLREVLDGQVNSWIPDLMPEMEGYLAALKEGAFAGLVHCRDYAAGMGRRVWGFKYPGWAPHRMQLLRHTLPEARFLCIYRGLAACVKSAKAQGELQSEEHLRVFCHEWKVNLQFMLGAAGDPAFLVLRYEDLAGGPEGVLGRIVEFTGVRSMRPEVLEHKVNGFSGGYTPPASLSEAEMKIVQESAESLGAMS